MEAPSEVLTALPPPSPHRRINPWPARALLLAVAVWVVVFAVWEVRQRQQDDRRLEVVAVKAQAGVDVVRERLSGIERVAAERGPRGRRIEEGQKKILAELAWIRRRLEKGR